VPPARPGASGSSKRGNVRGVARITVSTGQLAALGAVIRSFVRIVRRLSLMALGAVVVLVVLLQRDGFTVGEGVLTILCLAPPVVLLFFAQGVHELLSLPDRLRRLPGDGEERLAELTRLASEARTTRVRGLPLLLWRLRDVFGSVRDVAGVAVPLRVFTPGFLGVTVVSALLCVALPAVVLIVVLVIAFA
jgi:hypothetical protein